MYPEVPFIQSFFVKWFEKCQNWPIWPVWAQIPACRPLARPLIHQPGILQSPESPKSLHKLVLPENVPRSGFYTIIVGKMDLKVSKLANLAMLGPKFQLVAPLKDP